MLKKLGLVVRTIRYLKPVQIIFQFKNRIFHIRPLSSYQIQAENLNLLEFFSLCQEYACLKITSGQLKFEFLNLTHSYKENEIDWNFQGHGRLWNYNLQYLDFLRQTDIDVDTKLALLNDIYDKLWIGELSLEPYPASLRIMNVIRFLSVAGRDTNKKLEGQLAAEVNYLSKNLEYHILGNHLLENGFALLMGGHYFGEKKWIDKAEKLLYKQLEEQVLEDGAHFELSPMYHRIILFRVLEAIGYVLHNSKLRLFLEAKASLMLTWMVNMAFEDGKLPHFNDSTEDIAFSYKELLTFAGNLGIQSKAGISLGQSGYRRLRSSGIDLIMDVNGIAPTYQPGHAHADTLSFVMYANGKPIIVDPGISTYNISKTRDWERSTNAHNTVEIDGESSSEVWGGFRIGRRPKVDILHDAHKKVIGRHNGYKKIKGVMVERSIKCMVSGIEISDKIIGNVKQRGQAVAHLHFDPSCKVLGLHKKNTFKLNDECDLEIGGDVDVRLELYGYCLGYNKVVESKRLKITLKNQECKMTFHNRIKAAGENPIFN